MRNTLAIAAKDVRVYLTTWTSYIVFGAFLLMTAFFFLQLVGQFQYYASQYMANQAENMLQQMNLTDMVMGNVLRNIAVFFLFILPILTMRLLAEEKKGRTLELLMTAPVRPIEIVLGKYLAALAMMAIMLGLTVVFPLLLHIYGGTGAEGAQSPLDWSTIGVGYLGMFLLGSSFLAIGLFTSSLSDSQIVAVIAAFFILLMFFVIGYAARGGEGFWPKFFDYVSITTHLEDFIRGVIKVQGVVYYASLAFLGLFLTYRVVEAHRWR
jgi:ABC-2 type transport system permease protein